MRMNAYENASIYKRESRDGMISDLKRRNSRKEIGSSSINQVS
jgi:hypothetical protein